MSAARAEATDPAEPAGPSDDPASVTAASGPRWPQALGLHRRELRGWALYDWANSAFATVIGAAVFPIFYANVAAADLPANEATARYAFTASIALALMALLMPVLGAVADYLEVKKRLLGTFLALGALATATMFFHRPRRLGFLPRHCSCSAMSVCPGPTSSTTRCCPTLRARARWIASRRPATPWVTSVEGCCSRSI